MTLHVIIIAGYFLFVPVFVGLALRRADKR